MARPNLPGKSTFSTASTAERERRLATRTAALKARGLDRKGSVSPASAADWDAHARSAKAAARKRD